MTCPTCREWTATSEEVWLVRNRNILENPQVKVTKCPDCRDTDWALSRERIVSPPSASKHWKEAAKTVLGGVLGAVIVFIFIVVAMSQLVRLP